MSGVEIHAQFLEGLVDGDLLSRPRWARWAEAGVLALGGLLLIWIVPRSRVWISVAALIGLVAIVALAGFFGYLRFRLLLDAAWPALGLGVLFATMIGVALTEADSQRRALRRQVERQREAALRLAGELEAARRIQMGILPSPTIAFPGERRFTLRAWLEPAREVGGDLYDFFRLDADRVFVMIGDVSGKGLPGSLFMALAKSLFKSVALRRGGDIALVMREASAEISRDNGEGLFVTVWAGILDARTGDLEYCNAGHDPPYLLPEEAGVARRLADGVGPPLCVADDYPYAAASYRMRPGEELVLFTDGVTEATSKTGEFYGRRRLETVFASLGRDASAEEVGESIRRHVGGFASGVEPSDDLAILVLRWDGEISGR